MFQKPSLLIAIVGGLLAASSLLNPAKADNEGAIPVIAQLKGQPAMKTVYWYLVTNSNTSLISRTHHF